MSVGNSKYLNYGREFPINKRERKMSEKESVRTE